MKNTHIHTILQVVIMIFLVIIGYLIFTSNSQWEVISAELENAKEELQISRDSIVRSKTRLETVQKEFDQMKVQKDLLIHKRDSIIFAFKRKNAKDWEELQRIKDSIRKTNEQLTKDQLILDNLFGLGEN